MLALIIILSIIALLTILLLLPVTFCFKFENDFFFYIYYCGIPIYKVKPQKDISEPEKPDTQSDKQAEKEQKRLIQKLFKQKGFAGAIREIMQLVTAILNHCKKFLKHLYIYNLKADIIVATDNAASTAITYGAVCSAVYPVITLINSVAKVGMKQINIKADFQSEDPKFTFYVKGRIGLIFLLNCILGVFKEFKNFKTRNEM